MKVLAQSPLDDDFVQNPYAVYAQVLSDPDPVRFWADYGKPAVFSAAPVNALLRDRRLGRARPTGRHTAAAPHLSDFEALEAVSLLELEPPDHTRLRGLVLRAFTSRRIKALVPDIHAVCDGLLDRLPQEAFDLLPAYCTALPVHVIARLLGVPEEMSPQLLRWSNAMVAMYQAGRNRETEVAANAAARDFTAYLTTLIEEKQSAPTDDLISELIVAELDGKKLSRQEMIGTCVLLLNAGHEATVHTLGNAVKTLIGTRTPLSVLQPDRIAATVEELLRFDPPLHVFNRFAYEDLTLGDHQLRAGTEIMLVLGATGHDPKLLDRPSAFDPARGTVQHAAFGGGLHFCVGAPLARLELQIGLQRLFQACPSLRIIEPPRYANSYHFHGLERLVVAR